MEEEEEEEADKGGDDREKVTKALFKCFEAHEEATERRKKYWKVLRRPQPHTADAIFSSACSQPLSRFQ